MRGPDGAIPFDPPMAGDQCLSVHLARAHRDATTIHGSGTRFAMDKSIFAAVVDRAGPACLPLADSEALSIRRTLACRHPAAADAGILGRPRWRNGQNQHQDHRILLLHHRISMTVQDRTPPVSIAISEGIRKAGWMRCRQLV